MSKNKEKVQIARTEIDYSKMSTTKNGNINITTGAPFTIKEWTVGVPMEEEARKQLFKLAHMPFMHKHVAVMPDCLHIETEVLTNNGFVKITDLNGDELVANFNIETKNIYFSKVKNIIRRSVRLDEKIFEYKIDSIKKSIIVSENHKMAVVNNEELLASDINRLTISQLYWCGNGTKINNRNISIYEVLLLIWFWGDGNIKKTKNEKSINLRIRFGFKKERKINRLIYILNKLNYKYTLFKSEKQTEIYISTESSKHILNISPNKKIIWELINTFTPEEALDVINESVFIYGDYQAFYKRGTRRINSKSKEFVDFISAISVIYFGLTNTNGRMSNTSFGSCYMYYTSFISKQNLLKNKSGLHNKKIKRHEINYTDDVVCIECDTGFFVARQNGLCFITGNSHVGKGATIGSVIATKNAIIPAACGVDLGCGCVSVMTSLTASDLPDNLDPVRFIMEAALPHGRTDNGGANDRGSWGTVPDEIELAWMELEPEYKEICEKYPKIFHKRPVNQLGTLGSGNHHLSLAIDENQNVWILLHTGSRGPGNNIGSFFIEKAKEEMLRFYISLPDDDLAYLKEGTQYFDDYIKAVSWAQLYSKISRDVIVTQIYKALLKSKLLPKFKLLDTVINCHHNYINNENHFGEDVWVTRKGALSARTGELAIILASMGTPSRIVRGKGNLESFHSCSHGAGRVMSRAQARQTFTLKDHREATEGVFCRKDKDVIDETPKAYKDIEAVIAAQSDLIEVVHSLKDIVCIKG